MDPPFEGYLDMLFGTLGGVTAPQETLAANGQGLSHPVHTSSAFAGAWDPPGCAWPPSTSRDQAARRPSQGTSQGSGCPWGGSDQGKGAGFWHALQSVVMGLMSCFEDVLWMASSWA